jgi:ATP-binding cassette subfamily B protein RaxB
MSISRTFARRRSTAERSVQRLRFGFGRDLPMVMQGDAAESGLACLAMVAGYHGHTVDLAELRTRFPAALKGMTADALFEAGAGLHMEGRALSVDRTELHKLKLPCVLHWGTNHFVVLKKVMPGRGGIVIHDPAVGELRVRRSEVAKRCITVVALEFRPGKAFASQASSRPKGLAWMTGRMSGLGGSLMQMLLLGLSLQAFALATPLFMQWAVDGGIGQHDRNLVQLLAWGLALLVVVQSAIGAMRSWVVLYTMSHINLQWLANAFTHLLRLPASYFDQRPAGDVAARFKSIHAIQKAMGTGFVEGLLDGMLALALIGVMCFYNVGMAAVAAAAAAGYALLRWASYRPLKRATEQQLALDSKEQSFFLETIQRMQAIKLFGHEGGRRTRWLDNVVDSMNRKLVTQKLSLGLNGARALLGAGEAALLLWMASGLAIDGALTVGMLFAFASYKVTFSQRVTALIDKLVELQMLRLQGDRLADIVLTPAERTTGSAHHKPLPENAKLELRHVWFRYADSDPWVLQDVNLSFEAGESAAIVGVSGCGKTTLVKLVLGLLKPTQGEVLYGGLPLERIGARAYRKLVGAVMQEDQLMAGTVLDNIAFFSEGANVERATHCAEAAGIGAEIARMPMGYHTLVGGMDGALSSGQKQRLLLARAFYKRPKLLVLDEATSHVDGKHLSHINESLRDHSAMRLVVAHRVDAIRGIPRVIVIEDGMVAKDLSTVLVTVTDAVPMAMPAAVNDPMAHLPVLNNVLKLR